MWNSQVGQPEFFVFEFVEKKTLLRDYSTQGYWLLLWYSIANFSEQGNLSLWRIPCSILPLERTAFQQQFYEMPCINQQKFHMLPFIAPGEAPPDFESKQV